MWIFFLLLWQKYPLRTGCMDFFFFLAWVERSGFKCWITLRTSAVLGFEASPVPSAPPWASASSRLLAGQCGSHASRCCCCSGSPACRRWTGSTRVSPSTWTRRSPGASRPSADRSSASSASAARRRTRTRSRSRAPWPRRSCCCTTARENCWRSARVWPSPRASARAARRTTTPKRCRGSTCCPPGPTQVSPRLGCGRRLSTCGPGARRTRDGPNLVL